MKWADVQQIASRASCSTSVISLSLVMISRSVGWEIQTRLPKGCKRQNSWTRYKTLPTAHVEDVLNTIRTAHAWWVTKALKQEVKSSAHRRDCRSTSAAAAGPLKSWKPPRLPSRLHSERHFHISSRSSLLSVDVMVFKTSVLWCHQWLFIVYVLDNCDNA